MTMHKALHPRDDIDTLYVSRKERGNGLTSTENNVNASIRRFDDHTKKSRKKLITATRNNTNNTRNYRTRKQRWVEK